ncbi:hypothetical protein TW95_gp1561 [Pandoravirus inopinatum]|uniref:Uncharacterized protein n=1 Tax=Pandoravirus inopinatum TaxID=1605721 RepID=A0A0B5J8N6_9VIRU|nr:hypothetical protein TW95_gp1561 [Pandoravirus inopinatum]AJF98295.1 hypothetical protein [Pandoravirus inopinatum]
MGERRSVCRRRRLANVGAPASLQDTRSRVRPCPPPRKKKCWGAGATLAPVQNFSRPAAHTRTARAKEPRTGVCAPDGEKGKKKEPARDKRNRLHAARGD